MSDLIPWLHSLPDALWRAGKERRPVLLDWSDLPTCVGCVSLENNTYPDREVAAYVNRNFVPVQLNQREFQELFDRRGVIWTPTVSVLNAKGLELDRWVGYLPPAEFLARAKFARARVSLLSGNLTEAVEAFDDIAEHHAQSFIAADALYWLGVAKWKATRSFDALSGEWQKLLELYPSSEAAVKASCLSVAEQV
ncbi:MAG: thioredoxin fold domain-containing protein [Acidobacteria bacterium]|nr:thioredoxin fold domain-containing protein [Acidobacteriota bacterium]